MKSFLKSTDYKDIIQVLEYPDRFANPELISERTYRVRYRASQGLVQETLIDGLLIEHRNEQIPDGLCIEVDHEYPFLKMQFELEGNSSYVKASTQHKGSINVLIPGGHHQLLYLPHVRGRLHYSRITRRFTLEVKMTAAFLQRYFGENLATLEDFGKGILSNSPVTLASRAMPVTPTMRRLVFEIIHCPYHGIFRKLNLENKVIELLTLQFTQLQGQTANNEIKLNAHDIDKLHHAKAILETTTNGHLTTKAIAALTNLNEFKLKAGFKRLFGQTLFESAVKAKMEKGRQLLLENRHSIAEIAFLCGYKNAQHFTVAFKRVYHCLPKDIR